MRHGFEGRGGGRDTTTGRKGIPVIKLIFNGIIIIIISEKHFYLPSLHVLRRPRVYVAVDVWKVVV
jgi:hypothetical protein